MVCLVLGLKVRWACYNVAPLEDLRMATELEVFHFEDGRPNFETYARQNGFRHWLASELMHFLDYSGMQPIRHAINRAMAACAQLDISISENFQEVQTEGVGRNWKLSRFGCYLTVMNADPKKRRVAEAQAYFITMAEAFRQYVQEGESVERVVIRGEVSEREKAISGTVRAAA
jgi:DNA-damage-inducible protein D